MSRMDLLAGVLATKKHLSDSSGPKSEHFKELFSLLDFGSFVKVPRIVDR
jgi:hypothetical protein